MFKQKRTNSFLANFSYSFKSRLRECKVRLILTSILVVLGVFVGVFVAIRLKHESLLESAQNYGFIDFSVIKISSFSSFIWRFLSVLFLTALLVVFSLTVFIYPLAELILVYRGYLIGLNLVIIIISGGLTGIFTSVLILLPCQIVSLVILSLFFCIFSKQINNCEGRQKWKTVLFALVALFVVDIVESILLMLFGASVILVI